MGGPNRFSAKLKIVKGRRRLKKNDKNFRIKNFGCEREKPSVVKKYNQTKKGANNKRSLLSKENQSKPPYLSAKNEEKKVKKKYIKL